MGRDRSGWSGGLVILHAAVLLGPAEIAIEDVLHAQVLAGSAEFRVRAAPMPVQVFTTGPATSNAG